MQLKWRKTEGTQAEKPKEIDTTASPFCVYLRKNIQQKTKEQQDGDSITVWTYEEAALTLKEYAQYQKELADCNSLSQQELVENNLVVMGAIAEMFESIMDAIANINTTT